MKTIFILLIAIAFSSLSRSQGSYFHYRFSDAGGLCRNTILCKDSTLLSASWLPPGAVAANRISFIKIGLHGTRIWSSIYQIPECTYIGIEDVIQTTDSGFITLFNSNIPDDTNGYGLFSVVKIDMNGNFVFSRSFYSFTTNSGSGLTAKPDNGFILCGGGCQGQSYLINCDGTGNVIWQRQYLQFIDGQGNGPAQNIIHCRDGNYVVTGVNGNSAYIFKIDTLGNYIWHRYFDATQSIIGKKLIETPDSGFAVIGLHMSNQNGFIYKTNPDGYMQWCKFSNLAQFADITVDDANNIVIAGEAFTDTALNFMMTLDLSGNVLSGVTNRFMNMSFYLQNIINAGQRQFIICGDDLIGVNFIRIDSNGYPVCGFRDSILATVNVSGFSLTDTAVISPLNNFSCDPLLTFVAEKADVETDSITCTHVDVPFIENDNVTLSLFPNPAVTTLYITADSPWGRATSLTFQNLMGEEIHFRNKITGSTVEADISGLAPGIYFAIFRCDKFLVQRKFVKE